jgi:hypothetical protein
MSGLLLSLNPFPIQYWRKRVQTKKAGGGDGGLEKERLVVECMGGTVKR